MIHHVDKALESFLRQQVPLPETDVDLSFRAPEGSWTASVARPTVDVFLWDIARSGRSSSSGRDERVAENGRRQQRPQPHQVALRYFVTVWAREQRDEHELLGAILRSVLRYDALPATLLPPSLAESAWRLNLAGDQQRLPPSLWGGAPPKPGLYVEIELGVDAAGWQDRGLAVEEMHMGVVDRLANPLPVPEPEERPPLRRFRSGGALVMEGRPELLADGDQDEDGDPTNADPATTATTGPDPAPATTATTGPDPAPADTATTGPDPAPATTATTQADPGTAPEDGHR